MMLVKSYGLLSEGQKKLSAGDYKSAFWHGYQCWETIRSCFDASTDFQKGFCLKVLYQVSGLMSESLMKSEKREEAQLYLEKLILNFEDIYHDSSLTLEVRDTSYFYKLKISKELKILKKNACYKI